MGTNETAATDRMLEKVRKLIAKAEGTDSPEEREALIERANALMLQHQISEAMLEATRPAQERMKPEVLHYFKVAEGTSPIRHQLSDLANFVAEHFGGKAVFYGLGSNTSAIYITVVGYASDLRSFETLFTALSLSLASQINPKVDTAKSFDENVWRLRNAGVKWGDIALQTNRAYLAMSEEERAATGWKTVPLRADNQYPIPSAAYKRYCKKIGEAPRRTRTPIGYQREFATAFVSQVWSRLIDLRFKAREQDGAGTALALRSDSVDDLFAEKFPNLGRAKKRAQGTYNADARRAGRAAGDRADIGLNRTGSGSQRPELDG